MLNYFTLTLCALFSVAYSSPTYDEFYTAAKNDFPFYKNCYEHLHTIPELKFEEYETSKYIQQQLTEYGIKYTAGWGYNMFNTSQGGTGIIAEVGNGKGPCIGMRADFDALPIEENVDVPYKSQNPGKMHACGHDSHATMLLGAAKLAKQFEDKFDGTMKFFFQPGEEGGAGALMMINEGAMESEPKPEAMFAFHVTNTHPTGTVGSTAGSFTAASTYFEVKVSGLGGHAAMHYATIDPIPVITSIAQSINTFVARELYFQKDKAGVVSITNLYTGNTASFNVIPKEMKMSGTIRTFTHEMMNKIKTRITEIAEETAKAAHATATVTFPPMYYGPTYNNPEFFNFFKETMETANIPFEEIEPSMVGEDFSYFAEKVPSVMAFVGIGSGKVGPNNHPTTYTMHNANFAVDENVLPMGASMYTYFGTQAIEYLKNKSNSNQQHDEL